MYVDVIVPVSVPNTYTYGVPVEMQEQVVVGQRVEVQFGKRKRYSAVITEIHDRQPAVYEAKPILSILDQKAQILAKQLDFWKWMSQYYMANLGDVLTAALPGALRLSSESSIELRMDIEIDANELSDQEYLLFEALSNQGNLSYTDAQAILDKDSIFPILQVMMKKGIIALKENLKEKYKAKKEIFLRLHPDLNSETQLQTMLDGLNRAPKQQEAMLFYLSLTQQKSVWLMRKDFVKKTKTSLPTIKALQEKNILELESREVDRLEQNDVEPFSTELSPAQAVAKQEVDQCFDENKVCLLHGVTGSGKTHIYIQCIEKQLAENKQVLYLLPEIALTSQIIQRLQKHFGGKVGVYHSKYSNAERVEIWQKCLRGDYKIIVGARSSVFLPLPNLGLVIVDEEHDSSFKQYDPAPRYNGRDAGIWLAFQNKANVLLGSATPSFESYHNAQLGKYGLVELKERFGKSVLPKIEIVNLNKQHIPGKTYNTFSKRLIEELRSVVADGKQAILFRNRRGYSSIVQCKTCAHVIKCQNCDVSLTYHKYRDHIECHYCGFNQKVPHRCPACDHDAMEKYGLGTQRVEEELNVFLPQAKFGRMDWDTTRNKHGHQKIIDKFERKGIDILVGTQMVTKGLHFDDVRMVGILNADALMSYPDFRSGERALQLMEQVSGRAGRKDEEGLVLVQLRDESHPVIQFLQNHDYIGYYHATIEERRRFYYPPFYRQINVTIKHKDWKTTYEAALQLSKIIREKTNQQLKGPSEPMVSRIKNMYLQELLLTMQKDRAIIQENKQLLKSAIDLLKQQKGMSQVRVIVDVDPI